MKQLTLSIFLILFFASSYGQSTEEHEGVMKPVKILFEAMQKGDSASLHKAFAAPVTLATIGRDKNGKTVVKYEPLSDFLHVIGTPHEEVYNEMIWDEKILIDGNFAQVWTSYAFYLGKKFSHCGVDAFHLVKDTDGNWKIFHLADTRQKEGCKVPLKISEQFK
jgi:hypothetical protein